MLHGMRLIDKGIYLCFILLNLRIVRKTKKELILIRQERGYMSL